MDEEILNRAFEPFSQAEAGLKRSRGGFIDLHKGSVSIHSDGPGSGSKIKIRLPLTKSRPAKVKRGGLSETTDSSCRIPYRR